MKDGRNICQPSCRCLLSILCCVFDIFTAGGLDCARIDKRTNPTRLIRLNSPLDGQHFSRLCSALVRYLRSYSLLCMSCHRNWATVHTFPSWIDDSQTLRLSVDSRSVSSPHCCLLRSSFNGDWRALLRLCSASLHFRLLLIRFHRWIKCSQISSRRLEGCQVIVKAEKCIYELDKLAEMSRR